MAGNDVKRLIFSQSLPKMKTRTPGGAILKSVVSLTAKRVVNPANRWIFTGF